jgi:PAS domain-containing protein
MPFFICPNCKERSIDHDGRHGLLQQAVACERCGFGFLFELMDDYYPGPNTGFLVCDRQARILAVGRGVFELTGFRDADLMGRRLEDALDFSSFEQDRDPAHLALEWGVRRLGEDVAVRTRAGTTKAVKGDFFPAYDEDGGLLVALTPR